MRARVGMAVVSAAAVSILGAGMARGAIALEAWYQMGDADPGAVAGNVGNDPTVDSGLHGYDLNRVGTPRYSADVPPLPYASPMADNLSMKFVNGVSPVEITAALPGMPGPTGNFYRRLAVLTPPVANWGLEAWVKSSVPTPVDANGYALIAYNGTPFATPTVLTPNGVGFYQKGTNYIVRIGAMEKVLAPVVPGQWTHLAFLRYATANDFYVGADEMPDVSAAAQVMPIAPVGQFLIGGRGTAVLTAMHQELFNGEIDNVRFFTYSTTGPGKFEPLTDLLMPVPEPGMMGAVAAGAALAIAGRRRRS